MDDDLEGVLKKDAVLLIGIAGRPGVSRADLKRALAKSSLRYLMFGRALRRLEVRGLITRDASASEARYHATDAGRRAARLAAVMLGFEDDPDLLERRLRGGLVDHSSDDG